MGATAVSEKISRREGGGSALLWFGVLGGPAAWVLQLVVNYSLEEWFACSPANSQTGAILGLRVAPIALAVTGILGLVALAAGLVSINCYRRINSSSDDISSRAKWMALAGIMNSVLYFVLIIVSFGPPALLTVCRTSP